MKNRYGSTNEIGVFEMQDSGLHEVPNPSAMLLDGRPQGVSGTCVTCMMEGSRPILAEMQVLATKSGFSAPRRQTQGFDYSRMVILIAVLEKHLGLFFGTLDVYLNVVGGFQLDEPAGDLAAALCLYSSLVDKPISEKTVAFGEVGLGGEVRGIFAHPGGVSGRQSAWALTRCIVPQQCLHELKGGSYQIRIARRAESAAGVFRAGKGCERGCGKIIWAERVCIKCLCGKISPQALMGTHSG